MKNSLDYMLNPAKEFQAAKTWITLVYLAYNIKTALMNLSTQLNTMAALTSEYGEGTGIKLYTQALRDTASVQGFLNRAEKETNPKEKARLYELHSVVDKALRDGVLDQSYAYFLAGQANTAGALRATSNSWIGKTSHALMETGMLPFRITEKLNRKVTLLGFYQAERGRGASPSQAYDTAVQQTNLLQNSYDSGNKPELLRGKKSILMMFASYTQFQGWIMSGGYERAMRAQARSSGRNVVPMWRGVTVKLWLLYTLFGGLLGVPFAQNAMDVLQFIWRKFFGKTENIADEMRNLVKDLGGNPNVVMHGLLHDAGGFDLSGSFGLGRLIPGTDLLNRQTRNVEEFIGRGVLGFSGPAGGFYADMTKALSGFIQGNWLEGFKEFPGAGGAVAKTVDAILLQSTNPGQGVGVTTRTGERLTFDPVLGDFRDLTTAELAGMALGATTNLVSQNREERYAKVSEMIYWQTRRADLMDKYWKSVRTGDDELRDDTREVISLYNENLPDNSLRITGKDLAVSVRTRRKLLQEAEINGVSQKKYQGLARGIGEGFTP